MPRLPAVGATMATPHRDEEELKRVLTKLGVAHVFDEAAVHELYWKLGAIIGEWLSEQQRLEVSPVAKALLTTAKNLSEVSTLLSGMEPGLHTDIEIAVASQLASCLAIHPEVGSPERAQELLISFQQNAARMAHVCMVAVADLPEGPSERGRRALRWYDAFTALLLDIAKKAGVRPTLHKDRITDTRTGWLLDAARELESFLPKAVRSPSDEAREKRLERSRRHRRKRSFDHTALRA
jgi:hypothetical protein